MLRLLLLLLLALPLAGADCVPGVCIGEAADCCACLAHTSVDGDNADAAADANCLPDDISQGLNTKVEQDQCAADAGDSISGEGVVTTEKACREGDHPCADICQQATDCGVDFDDL